jgi:competence protein ComGC
MLFLYNRTMSSFRPSHPRAFTMMEMIIFMTMTVIIMGITVSSVGAANKRAKLKSGVNIVVDAIQTARVKAMSNLEVQSCAVDNFEIEADSTALIPQQIRIRANFADPTCASGFAILESFNLPKQVQVRLDPDPYPATQWPSTFAYTTPGGDVDITMSVTILLPVPPTFDLVISQRDGSMSQTITISTFSGIPELN